MIKSIEFINFRNLNKKYSFDGCFNVITGLNNSGKTNLLHGVSLAFSAINGDYIKIRKSDFLNSDDSKPFEILVELEYGSIPSFNYEDETGSKLCGFKVLVRKTKSGKYIKDLLQYNGVSIARDIILDDTDALPNIYSVPLYRIEDLYAPGLSVGLSKFLDSEERYKDVRENSQKAIKSEIASKEKKFVDLVSNFTSNLRIAVTEPSIGNEKLFITDGEEDHNMNIGSGYKSIANMFLCVLDDKTNILLIDEIENHVHPSLLRSLIRELSALGNLFVICSTHSPIVINEVGINSLIEMRSGSLSSLGHATKTKLNLFLHPGRGEIIVSENIVLVEGYTEELILKDYVSKNKKNWKIVNVAGVMFDPYVELASFLGKKTIVISDDDKSNNSDKPTTRFDNLKGLCNKLQIPIIQVNNTLETDLFNNNFLSNAVFKDLMRDKSTSPAYKVAKDKCKTEIALQLIENKIDISRWHVIIGIESGFKGI